MNEIIILATLVLCLVGLYISFKNFLPKEKSDLNKLRDFGSNDLNLSEKLDKLLKEVNISSGSIKRVETSITDFEIATKAIPRKSTRLISPLISLDKIWDENRGKVYAKIDMLNPTKSVKYNMVEYILDMAMEKGIIQKGSTIIESLVESEVGKAMALWASKNNCNVICAVNSRMSKDSIDLLHSIGIKLYVCPAHVSADDPRSFLQVAKRIHQETPKSIYLNLPFNFLNQEAHYKITGPEIWEQTRGKITHFVTSIRTGGTISGVGKYLKERNPNVKIIGIDPYGSVLKKYWHTGEFDDGEIYPYRMTFGSNMIPTNLNIDVIDNIVKVSDEEAAYCTRDMARIYGILFGYTSGASFLGLIKIENEMMYDSQIVIYFPDNGGDQLSKVFNDQWIDKQGFKNSKQEIQQIRKKLIEYLK